MQCILKLDDVLKGAMYYGYEPTWRTFEMRFSVPGPKQKAVVG